MAFDREFHFFCEDLLTTAVDGDGVAAQELQAPICLEHRTIAGNRISNALNFGKRLRSLGFILEVSERYVSTPCEPTDVIRPGFDHAREVVSKHVVLVRHIEVAGRRPGIFGRIVCRLRTRLR